MSCPWGSIQHVEPCLRGVAFVSTASHGGLRVASRYAFEHLSQSARDIAYFDGKYFWFEEDCDYAVAALEMPEIWDVVFKYSKDCHTYMQRKEELLQTVKFWNIQYALDNGLAEEGDKFNCKNWHKHNDVSYGIVHLSIHVSTGINWECGVCGTSID